MVRYSKLRISLFVSIVTLSIFIVCFRFIANLTGRKALLMSPSRSVEYSKSIGAYVAAYGFVYVPYVDIPVDSLMIVERAFVEKSHRWYSYDSDSIVFSQESYDFVVWFRCYNQNIVFPNFLYGDDCEDKYMLQHELRQVRNVNDLRDTISTYVVWAPSSHFELGLFSRYKSTLKNGFYDFNDVDAYKKYEPAEGAIVLGLLQFIRIKDEDNE